MSYSAPRPTFTGHAISTFGPWWTCLDGRISSSAIAWTASDLALYIPVIVPSRVIVKKMGVGIGTASGNWDVGIYDSGGTRLVSSGASLVVSADCVVDVTDTTIGPGLFYFAAVFDNTTVTVRGAALAAPNPAAFGVLVEQLGASGTLPATATFALSQTLASVPGLVALLETTPT